MVVSLMILNFIIPNVTTSRMTAIIQIIIYGIVGMIIYFVVAYKSKTIDEILGKGAVKNTINKLKNKLKQLTK